MRRLLALGAGYRFGEVATLYFNVEMILDFHSDDSSHYWYGNVTRGRQLHISSVYNIAIPKAPQMCSTPTGNIPTRL